MNNINCLVVEGHITRQPEFKTTPNGFPICKIPIAVNHFYKKASSEKYENEVSYFDVETFGKLAEICAKYSAKGRGMSVVGRIKQNRWKTDDGKNASHVTIIAEKVEFKQRFAAKQQSDEKTEIECGDAPIELAEEAMEEIAPSDQSDMTGTAVLAETALTY